MMDDLTRETIASAVKVAPPVAISGALQAGAHIDDWIKVVTLMYLTTQFVWLLTRIGLSLWRKHIVGGGESDE